MAYSGLKTCVCCGGIAVGWTLDDQLMCKKCASALSTDNAILIIISTVGSELTDQNLEDEISRIEKRMGHLEKRDDGESASDEWVHLLTRLTKLREERDGRQKVTA